MAHTFSLTKIIYDPARFKTPNFKETATSSAEQNKDATPNNTTILMDEFGQTPDHFYLARKPPTFLQVKRKLDLQSYEASAERDTRPVKRKRKTEVVTPKSKAKNVADKPRYDTSLGQLTKKFLKLLSDASDGVINLNTACTLLCVPKRRLYDITNVLEGAGLIQKTSRNNIQWMGRDTPPIPGILKYELEKEIDVLEAKENKLDELIYHMKTELCAAKESDGDFHYVTSEDLKSIEEFSKKMVVGIKIAPSGQVIEAFERKMVLTSKSSELEAFLLSEDVSFTNILHPRAQFKENTYNVQLSNNSIAGIVKEEPSESVDPCYAFTSPYKSICSTSYSRSMYSGNTWSEGDMIIKNAFITEEEDIAPMGKNFLLQTEDQDLDTLPFAEFDPPIDTYSFSLDDGEGLTDLFDCHFHCP